VLLGQYPGIKKSQHYCNNNGVYKSDEKATLQFVSVSILQRWAATHLAGQSESSVCYTHLTFLQLHLFLLFTDIRCEEISQRASVASYS
jgi:hypothetical protein